MIPKDGEQIQKAVGMLAKSCMKIRNDGCCDTWTRMIHVNGTISEAVVSISWMLHGELDEYSRFASRVLNNKLIRN